MNMTKQRSAIIKVKISAKIKATVLITDFAKPFLAVKTTVRMTNAISKISKIILITNSPLILLL